MTKKGETSAEGILLLNRWVKAVATLLGAEAGCIILTDQALARVVARHNIPHAFLVSVPKLERAPWERDETVILPDARNRHDVHEVLGDIALERTGFFFRFPLIADDVRTFAMLIFDRNTARAPGPREMRIIAELAGAIRDELLRYFPGEDPAASRSIHLSTSGLHSWLDQTPTPTALLDHSLRLLALNAQLTALFPGFSESMIGQPITNLNVPARESLGFLFQHALNTGRSTPKLEAVLEDTGQRLQVMASPVEVLDGDPVLVVTIEPMGEIEPRPIRRGARRSAGPEHATVSFLSETLVRRRALRSRNGVSYITVRSWRQSIRQHQIRALRAIKEMASDSLADDIAADIEADLAALIGHGVFRGIVPMPCGHSSDRNCLSRLASVALGRRLDLPVLHALAIQQMEGTSHPRTNRMRPPIRLLHDVEGPILLIDDVATSGQHIEEATLALRKAGGSVMALAWIGGDAVDTEPDDP